MKKTDTTPSPESGISASTGFEAGLAKLAGIVESLEKGDASLEEAVALYQDGLVQAKQCRQALDKARHKVTISRGSTVEDFAPSNSPHLSEENGTEHGDY